MATKHGISSAEITDTHVQTTEKKKHVQQCDAVIAVLILLQRAGKPGNVSTRQQ